jgi:excisionase family DNA binding protein
MADPIVWLSTKECCARLGVTVRTLYRFIDEGQLVAYQMGRVIRVQEQDLDRFIESVRISPGSRAHLYPATGGNHDIVNGNGHLAFQEREG